MKKKIAILGSTGSIGCNMLKIIEKDLDNYEIILLTANNNYIKLLNQAKKFKVKNLIINNKKGFNYLIKKTKKLNIKIYQNHNQFNKIFQRKADYVMCSIMGLDGLNPTIKIIKHTKKIAIANKGTLICAWNLINKELHKYKTKFIPVDSEHYSISVLLKNYDSQNIENIYITASGGPFLNYPKSKFRFIKPINALNHPNWKMGKKITIDSSTLMNKVFEVIEAKNIFNIPYKKISILTHPNSYIHAIIKFKNGLIKIIAHEPDMKIPIFNSLNDEKFKSIHTKPINIKILNNLNLENVNSKKFSFVKILDQMPKYSSLFETILITVNDHFVDKFLKKEINFKKMIYLINKFANFKKFQKYKKIKPKNAKDIYQLRDYVSSKMNSLVI